MSRSFDITGRNGAPRQAGGEDGCELADRGIQPDSRWRRG